MELAAYTDLIKQMPYRDQSFETQRATWESFKSDDLFRCFYKATFKNAESVIISRGELFEITKEDTLKAIFSIILWGYPRGYTRANNMARSFPLFLKQAEYLSKWLTVQKQITVEDLAEVLRKCKGVGLSTLSKLLYFFNTSVEGYKSIIMDARIISVLKQRKFTEFQSLSSIREHNKEQIYPKYLKLCTQLSKMNGYEADQLELFLFIFGNNLKQSKI